MKTKNTLDAATKILFDKVSSPESEQYVLAYLTQQAETAYTTSNALLTEAPEKLFNGAFSRKLMRSAIELKKAGKTPTLDVLATEICFRKKSEEKIHLDELVAYLSIPVNESNYQYHLCLCYEAMMRRFSLYQGLQMIERAKDLHNDIFDEVNNISELVFEYQKRLPIKARNIKAVVGDSVSNFLDRQKRYLSGEKNITFGLPQLDEVTYELPKGGMTVVAARPGHGKTSLMLQYIVEQCKAGRRTLVHSLEMTEEQIVDGLVCYLAGFDRTRYTRGLIGIQSEQEEQQLWAATDTIDKWPLTIHYFGTEKKQPYFDTVIGQLRADCETAKAQGAPVEAIATDYFQLLKPAPNDKTQTRDLYRIASSQFMALAKEYNYHHLLLSQLNRGAAGAPPKASHMAETDQLERDATQVILLYRPIKDGEDTFVFKGLEHSSEGVCLINVTKNRLQGTEGIVVHPFQEGRFLPENQELEPQF